MPFNSQTTTTRADNLDFPPDFDNVLADVSNVIDEINDSNVLECDTECQERTNLRGLHQAYIDARDRKQDAPLEYRIAERNFLIARHSERGYRDIIDQRNEERLSRFITSKQEDFNNKKQELNKNINTLKTLYKDDERIKELILKYKKENQEMRRKIKYLKNSENITNRETYYTNDRIMFYYNLYSILRYINWFLLLLFIVILFLSEKYKKRIYQYFAGGLILFAIFPFSRYIIAPLYNT